MYVGLTGTIASGKSTAAKLFNNLGAFTIDLDEISKELLNINNIGYNEVVRFFGKNILAKDGSIDRAKLKNIIFKDKSYKKALEDILHPLIRKKEIEIVNDILSKNKSPIIIVHAALFIETQSFKRYDSLIVVYAKKDICYNRLIKRDNVDESLASSIIASQLSIDKKLEYANFIINNNKDYDNLKVEVGRIYNILKMYETTKNILLKNKQISKSYYKSFGQKC